jgi:hypothetical protein
MKGERRRNVYIRLLQELEANAVLTVKGERTARMLATQVFWHPYTYSLEHISDFSDTD